MSAIPDELKVKYFDIILEFGLVKDVKCPTGSLQFAYQIPLMLNFNGSTFKTTAFGTTIPQACEAALEWLTIFEWQSHSPRTREGVLVARAIAETIAEAVESGKTSWSPQQTWVGGEGGDQ